MASIYLHLQNTFLIRNSNIWRTYSR